MNKKIYLVNNDTYFLAVAMGKIIVNDNYNGLIILNGNLDIEKRLNITEGMVIYSYFCCGKYLVLYCPDVDQLIMIDLQTYQYRCFNICEFCETVFSPVYCYNDGKIILSGYEDLFVEFDVNRGWKRILRKKTVQNRYRVFYRIHELLHQTSIIKMDWDKKIVITDSNGVISIKKFSEDKIWKLTDFKSNRSHDYECIENIRLEVSETSLKIYQEQTEIDSYRTDENHIFLRGKFYENKNILNLITLGGSKNDENCDYLEKVLLV